MGTGDWGLGDTRLRCRALAVAPSGDILGSFRETLGEGVTRTCAFFLAGKAAGDQATVTTWYDAALPGTLTVCVKVPGPKLRVPARA